jgi:hypothetical protein
MYGPPDGTIRDMQMSARRRTTPTSLQKNNSNSNDHRIYLDLNLSLNLHNLKAMLRFHHNSNSSLMVYVRHCLNGHGVGDPKFILHTPLDLQIMLLCTGS